MARLGSWSKSDKVMIMVMVIVMGMEVGVGLSGRLWLAPACWLAATVHVLCFFPVRRQSVSHSSLSLPMSGLGLLYSKVIKTPKSKQ